MSIGASNPVLPVDVVILTWNDAKQMLRAVDSVFASDGVAPNIYVVDNGSEPPAEPPLTSQLHVIRLTSNLGVAAGRNRGARQGSAEYVCFLDSDATVESSTLRRLIDPLLTDPAIALSAPVYAGQRPEQSAGRVPGLGRKLVRALGLTDSYAATRRRDAPCWDVGFAIGACQVFRRSAFAEVGGLDERYFYGPEDVDFCVRLRAHGHRVVQVGSATCCHAPRRHSRSFFTPRGLRHTVAVARFLWEQRRAIPLRGSQ